jgi:nicotinamidase/pyrazinamidase
MPRGASLPVDITPKIVRMQMISAAHRKSKTDLDAAALTAEFRCGLPPLGKENSMASEALIVVDLQNDFCPGGALAVVGGDEIVPIINKLMHEFEHVILTQDWHPAHHSSFASSHPGKSPFETIEMPYGPQTLWPDHCIQGTSGAAFHPHFVHDKAELIIRKGFRKNIDSYSAFFENDHTTHTGLAGYLRERGIRGVTIAGLATDYCVAYSALDSVGRGFTTNIRLDACRGIDLGGSIAAMVSEMKAAGVKLLDG